MINLSSLSEHLRLLLGYLQRNGWTIVFILAGSYYVYWNYLDPVVHRVRTDRSYRQATDPDRVAVLSPDMRRVRASQQAAAAERALAAEEERIAKAKAERERKRVMTPTEERFEKRGGEGTRLGDDGTKKEGGGSGVGRNGTAAGSSRSTGRRREPRAPPPGSSFGSSNQSGM